MATGTIQKWTCTAGPRQTKAVNKAMADFRSRAKSIRQLHGTFGGETRESIVIAFCGEPSEESTVALQEIGERFAWTVTRENHKDVIQAFQDATAELTLPIEDNRITKTEANALAERRTQREQEERERKEAGERKRAEFEAKRPSWATAVIVAEQHVDQSDSMTDYYGHTIARRVAIGWRKGKRESFKALREAAAGFAETEHLGPGKDVWTACHVWDHNSYDEAAREAAERKTNATYYKGQPCHGEAWSPKFETEAELLEWLADRPAERGTEWRVSCEEVEHRENYSMGGGNYLKRGHRHGNGWSVRSYDLGHSVTWHDLEDAIPDPDQGNTEAVDGAAIVEHFHTKRGQNVYIVTLAERVDRDEFDRLRSEAKALGGWYSRKWQGSPAGFAFADRTVAERFIGGEQAKPTETRTAERKVNRAEKLRELADRMEDTIQHKLRPLDQNPTHKRLRELRSRQHDGDNLQRAQRALRTLADAHEAGTVPAVLADVKTKAEVCRLMRTYYGEPGTCNADEHGKYADQSEKAVALQQLADADHTPADPLQRKIEAAEHNLRFQKITGFFPTPPALARQVVEAADIKPGAKVLEPSAGIGSLAEAVKEAEPSAVVTCVEVAPSMVELLKLKGFNAFRCDFLDCPDAAGLKFDRIVMNPPFERSADIDHVRQAFGHLRKNGRLVAIMSAGVEFRSDRKTEEFRSWLDSLGGTIEHLPDGAFQGAEAFRQTGVRAVLVTIDN